jgi:hypothetical protein
MPSHHFISYSSVDARDFALKLMRALESRPSPWPAWLDQRDLKPGIPWDEQLAEAIRACDSLIFVMTRDSVDSLSTCKQEWTRALKYKKPIIPILLHSDAEMPFRLEPRQYIDFTGAFKPAVKKLREHLIWRKTPEATTERTTLLKVSGRISYPPATPSMCPMHRIVGDHENRPYDAMAILIALTITLLALRCDGCSDWIVTRQLLHKMVTLIHFEDEHGGNHGLR